MGFCTAPHYTEEPIMQDYEISGNSQSIFQVHGFLMPRPGVVRGSSRRYVLRSLRSCRRSGRYRACRTRRIIGHANSRHLDHTGA